MTAVSDLPQLADPEFPPVFTGHAVAVDADPATVALKGAAEGIYGAGDVVWAKDQCRAAAAFVLEPETSLATAVQMLPVLMVAIGDALGAIGPPNLALTFRWPVTILANGGVVGKVVFRTSPTTDISAVPEHIVIGFDLVLDALVNSRGEPGRDPNVTALFEEGCGDLDRTAIIEAVARHFLSWIDGWTHGGFRAAHQSWLSRANDLNRHVDLSLAAVDRSGTMVGLDEDGGLLLRTRDGTSLVALPEALGVGT